MCRNNFAALLLAVTAVASATFAQGGTTPPTGTPDRLTVIQQKLAAEYALTQPTADQTDIVTPGAILKLRKGELVMVPISNSNLYQNTYKNGQITQNALGKWAKWGSKFPKGGSVLGGSDSKDRTFVAGEKMWVTKIDVKADGITFDLFSDPYNDVRYKAALKFAFEKGSTPSPEQADQLVAEVFSAQPFDSAGGQQQNTPAPSNAAPRAASNLVPASQTAPAAPQAPATPPDPIPPPPPPADQQSATVNLGMTPEQVIANLGQPTKKVVVGAKTIFIYKDMKVTFVNNKVTDVE